MCNRDIQITYFKRPTINHGTALGVHLAGLLNMPLKNASCPRRLEALSANKGCSASFWGPRVISFNSLSLPHPASAHPFSEQPCTIPVPKHQIVLKLNVTPLQPHTGLPIAHSFPCPRTFLAFKCHVFLVTVTPVCSPPQFYVMSTAKTLRGLYDHRLLACH